MGKGRDLLGAGALDVRCFAVETLRLIEETGGERGAVLGNLGISVAGLMGASDSSYDQFMPEEYGEAARMAEALNRCDRLVGYGIGRFDLPVLKGYLPCVAPLSARSVDLMEEIQLSTGRRVSLSNLCRETLGRDLPMAGIQSPLEWRGGNRGAVARRLAEKLKAIRELYLLAESGEELCFVQPAEGGFEVSGVRLDIGVRRL